MTLDERLAELLLQARKAREVRVQAGQRLVATDRSNTVEPRSGNLLQARLRLAQEQRGDANGKS